MVELDSFLHIRRSERGTFASPGQRFSTAIVGSQKKAIGMTLRQKLLKLGLPAHAAVFAVSICAFALSPEAYAESPKAVSAALMDSLPLQVSAAPTATFFTINAVLAKLDRSQGRGRDAIRLVSLKASNTTTDAGPGPTVVPVRGTEPFGLFAFRAP